MQKKDEVGGGRLRVPVGTKVSLIDAFYATITASANNTGMALARVSGLGLKTFVARMNQTVKTLGLKHTTFFDPVGMDPRNLTTAHDMALLAEAAFRLPMVQRAATVQTYNLKNASTGDIHPMKSTDPLLSPGNGLWVMGGKTGYLEESMYNFVGWFRPEQADGTPVLGKDVIVVVFGAPTKEGQFDSAKRLAQWAWSMHAF